MKKSNLVALMFLGILGLSLLPSALSAQPWQETIVGDLGNPGVGDGCPAGLPNFAWRNLDADGFTGAGEDADGDELFGSIGAAITNTRAGGVVEIVTSGVYRENLTINKNLTIRAMEDVDAVLEGGMGLCTQPTGSIGITVSGGVTVTLENLTIRGYQSAGIVLSGTGQTVTVIDCNVDENGGSGIQGSAGDETLRVRNSRIRGNAGDGISVFDPALLVTDTVIADNRDRGIVFGNQTGGGSGGSIAVYRSQILRNGSNGFEGIRVWSGQTDLRIADTLIAENDQDGLLFTNNATDLSVSEGILVRNRIHANGNDGITLTAQTCAGVCTDKSFITLGFSKNSVSLNSSIGLRYTDNVTVNCTGGDNELVLNAGGHQSGPTNCPATPANCPCLVSQTNANMIQ